MGRQPDIKDSHPLADEILSLHYKGFSDKAIVEHCVTEGFPYNQKQVRAYIASKQPPKPESTEETKPKKKSGRQPIIVGLSEFTERFQIPDDLSNAESIASALQRMSACAVMTQYACVIAKIEAYAAGEIDKSPDDQIKSLKLLMDCYTRMWGIDNIINISTAMRTLEATGYRIDAVNAIEESVAKIDSATLSGDEE